MFKFIGARILTSGLLFTSYFRSPNWQRHATKKVRSFIPCHFIIFGERSDPPRNLRVPDLPLADSAIYGARVLKTHKGRHKTRVIKVI